MFFTVGVYLCCQYCDLILASMTVPLLSMLKFGSMYKILMEKVKPLFDWVRLK